MALVAAVVAIAGCTFKRRADGAWPGAAVSSCAKVGEILMKKSAGIIKA